MVVACGRVGVYSWLHEGLPLRTELELMNRTEVTFDGAPLLTGGGTNYALSSTVQNVSLMLKGYWYLRSGNPEVWPPFIYGGICLSRNDVTRDLTTIGSGPGQQLEQTRHPQHRSLCHVPSPLPLHT